MMRNNSTQRHLIRLRAIEQKQDVVDLIQNNKMIKDSKLEDTDKAGDQDVDCIFIHKTP